MEVLLLGLSVGTFLASLITLHKVSQIADQREMPEELVENRESFPDSEELPEHIVARENEFTARIEQIKDELAKQYARDNTPVSIADELHPFVKNMPHDDIYKRFPDVEVAE